MNRLAVGQSAGAQQAKKVALADIRYIGSTSPDESKKGGMIER